MQNSTVSALEMRKKFGTVIDRVHKHGMHVTVTRDNVPVAVLIPIEEYNAFLKSQSTPESIVDALDRLNTWQKLNASRLNQRTDHDVVKAIRDMRSHR